MPNYEYHCPRCGQEFEQVVPIAGRDMMRCDCGFPAIRKPSNPAIQFKGSGFYETDYKKKST